MTIIDLFLDLAAGPPLPDLTGAVCASADPEAWFPKAGGGQPKSYEMRVVIGICQVCPVLAACRRYAMADPDLFGTWGGLSRHDRQRARARAHASQPVAPTPIKGGGA